MRMKLVVIGVVLILLSAIIFTTMIMTGAEEKVIQEETLSPSESMMKLARSFYTPPEPEPLPDYIVPGIAVLLLTGGLYILARSKNENFLPGI